MSLSRPIGSALKGVERAVTAAAVWAGSLMLVVAVLTGMWQVIARFVLFQTAAWSEPLIQTSLVWMAYLALAGAMRAGTLISVDVLLEVTRGPARRALRLAGAAAVFGLLAVLVWFGAELCWRVRFQTLAGLGIPASYAYAALPVGSAISILALAAHLLDPAPPAGEAPDTNV
ncbi:TRAP transporter small permease [Jiella sonneratiae]|uniref:TRAP transporter small permease protein n=1 Tax=Jiella sonneratiae TaxID=2816856 RepID=A0ABS3JBZ8_9HYPH|nr:TRAP transporter small permease subunit [Jiella sonneratiae]MBO0906101.1 TRAP transporter small permease subunit [Jiella sonneratiae]